MRAVDLIDKKRHGHEHTPDELRHLIDGHLSGEVPDYQMAAWLMAVCLRGMTRAETAALTQIMAASGDTLDLSELPHTVDKHSTGGVGDKTSLVLAPLLASCGATVAKMSGRGLGHTGGTIDKLEAIPGFSAELDERNFIAIAKRTGVVLSGQSLDLAPADGALYALRDATATVQSLPLIASSIMSKKLASGAESIVLDVKVGSGAFMKDLDEAEALAQVMIDIGKRAGRRVRAVLSSMEQPLGHAVGNALEVAEAVRCLQGEGPRDLESLCLTLAAEVLGASGLDADADRIKRQLTGGSAFNKFVEWVEAQGGDSKAALDLPVAPERERITADAAGFVARADALEIGRAVAVLGGGRRAKGDAIDPRVGVVLHRKLGEEVRDGEPLATVYHAGRNVAEARGLVKGAISIAAEPPPESALTLKVLR